MIKRHAQRAFTLLELSIVFMVVALISGGVLMAQYMVRQAQLNKIITEADEYTKASKAFKDKYLFFPGDMPNAVSMWGAAAGNSGDNYTTSCYATAGTGTQTCNGNADGQIAWYGNEGARAWQHLVHAQMVKGAYTGLLYSSPVFQRDVNVPAAAVDKGWWLPGVVMDPGASDGTFYRVRLGFFMHLSGPAGAGALRPREAQQIDKKIDDGFPASGKVLGSKSDSGALTCTSSDTMSPPPTYSVSVTTDQCKLTFISGF